MLSRGTLTFRVPGFDYHVPSTGVLPRRYDLARRRECVSRSNTRFNNSVTSLPRRIDRYFEDNIFRTFIWCFISMFGGYYSGNMVSLAFGALAINDVVAAVTTVAFCEVVSRTFYESWPRPPLWLLFVNCFKCGVEFAFIADALKLAG